MLYTIYYILYAISYIVYILRESFVTHAWTTADQLLVQFCRSAGVATANRAPTSRAMILASDPGSLSGPEWRIPGGNFSGRLKWIWSTLLGA